ncbi:MAG: hypothetical protein ACYC1G_04975 [Thiobacillus sp.]
MTMPKFKPGSDPRGGHVRLYHDIVDSNAWRCLSATDQRAYIALQRQLKSFNNGDLSLPLSFARNHGIKSSATLAKSLRALIAVGLIAVTRRGGCTKGGQRLATLYRFTDHEAYEVPAKHLDAHKPSNEWRNVKTLAQGRHLIQQAEAEAAEKEASKKKSLLQSLIVTASNNEAVGTLTASNNEAWPTVPLQKLKHGKASRNGRKANNDGASGNTVDFPDSENHTSNTEVLSTCYQVGGADTGTDGTAVGRGRIVGGLVVADCRGSGL